MLRPVLVLCSVLAVASCGGGGGGGTTDQTPMPPDEAPSVTLLSPNGGETWGVGLAATITWDPGTYTGAVDLDLSLDGGATWQSLVAGTGNDGAETVVVPDLPSVAARVEVSAADGDPSVALDPSDASDADFSIVTVFVDLQAGIEGVGAITPFGSHAAVAWGDYDGDGDLDLALAGRTGSPTYTSVTRVYRNDAGVFTDIGAGLLGVGGEGGAALAWGDYDDDGDLDLAVAGKAGSPTYTGIARIYRNDAGTFVDSGAVLPGVGEIGGAALAWGDLDGDGDLDLVLVGITGAPTYGPLTRVFRNDGGTFTDAGATGLDALGDDSPDGGSVALALGDVDGDGDLDVVAAGRLGAPTYNAVTRVYLNQGGFAFADMGAGIVAVGQFGGAALSLGDYDADGDLDLLVAGNTGAPTYDAVTRVYRNDGGAFTDVNAGLPGVGRQVPMGGQCAAAWGDLDADGDLDIAISGLTGAPSYSAVTRVYRNDGGAFTDVGAGLTAVGQDGAAALAWGDFDRDGALDLAVVGQRGAPTYAPVALVYRNVSGVVNDPPSAPTNVVAYTGGGVIGLSWDPASDAETPSAGLSYNLRVGNVPLAGQHYPSMSDALGLRRIAAHGPISVGLPFPAAWLDLGPGVYWISVQAVDSGFAGGPWSDPIPVAVP